MQPKLMAAVAVALGMTLPPAAAQTADFLTAKKVACTPDRIISCGADNKCETKDATAADKAEVLVIDFTAKKASVRKSGKEEPFGEIVDDKVEGDTRSFAVKSGTDSLPIKLTKDGKLTLLLDGEKNRAEATCAAEG